MKNIKEEEEKQLT